VKRQPQFVICIGNKGYAASLELRKIYQALPDKAAPKVHQIRVIDESAEDYLYPQDFFAPVRLPQSAGRTARRATAQGQNLGRARLQAVPQAAQNQNRGFSR
jgi:hypothetical protein